MTNEMNGVLGHHCAHTDQTGPGKPPGDGEMNEMTLSSRHRIRNMTFNYRNCTVTRNAVETSSKIWITLVSIFICVNETLDQITQFEIRYYIVFF